MPMISNKIYLNIPNLEFAKTFKSIPALSVGHRIRRLYPLQRGKIPPPKKRARLLVVGGYP